MVIVVSVPLRKQVRREFRDFKSVVELLGPSITDLGIPQLLQQSRTFRGYDNMKRCDDLQNKKTSG